MNQSLLKVVTVLRQVNLRPHGVPGYTPVNFSAYPIGAPASEALWWRVEAFGVVWELSDNGGEIVVEKVNEERILKRRVQMGSRNEAVLASGVACILRGDEELKFEEFSGDDLETFLK